MEKSSIFAKLTDEFNSEKPNSNVIHDLVSSYKRQSIKPDSSLKPLFSGISEWLLVNFSSSKLTSVLTFTTNLLEDLGFSPEIPVEG